MFYNSEMLTKRGPLARVWMASHLSTKLTKTNLLATSIPSSVSSILGEALLPMALRLSGQLLLGVARIYSRKAKYLLDDCNETLGKVKKAFKPGMVDMEDNDATRGGGAAITLGLQEGGLEDILNQYDYGGNQWDFAAIGAAPAGTAAAKKSGKANTSNKADITLPDHSMAWDDNYGLLGGFDNGIDGGLDSQEQGFFDEEFELGILDEEGGVLEYDENAPVELGRKRARSEDELRSEGDMSVEAGRHASVHASDRGSIAGDLNLDFGKDIGNDMDLGGMDFLDQRMDFDDAQGFDLGDLAGLGDDVMPPRPRFETPAVPSINGDLEESLGLTPKTAADLAAKRDNQPNPAKKPKLRKQVVDAVTELEWQAGRSQVVRFKEPSYLPSSRLHLRLLELESDPTNYLPKPLAANTELFAPLGFASELDDLYALPTRRQRIKLEGRELAKPARVAAVAGLDDDVELGREREASYNFPDIEPFDMDRDMGGPGPEDFGGMEPSFGGGDYDGEGFQFDLGPDAGAVDREATPKASASQARKKQKVHGSAGGSDYLFDEDAQGGVSQGPLAIFDVASAQMQASQAAPQSTTQAQSLATAEEEEAIAGGSADVGSKIKWSKNTKKAIRVLQDELATVDEENVDVPRTMKFEKVAEKATRRAASSFFFELLVLSTRECVRIEQPSAYGAIEVQAKEKLWETVVDEVEMSQSQAIAV